MTNSKILSDAIDKAVKNGYANQAGLYVGVGMYDSDIIYGVIFSHKFAKAFWKKGKFAGENYGYNSEYDWQYHLQMMVLEEKPLKYLEKYL